MPYVSNLTNLIAVSSCHAQSPPDFAAITAESLPTTETDVHKEKSFSFSRLEKTKKKPTLIRGLGGPGASKGLFFKRSLCAR